jgi:hypothetical protein
MVNRLLVDLASVSQRALGQAEYLEQRGEYVEALKIITAALLDDPSNKELQRKYSDLQAILCWRC